MLRAIGSICTKIGSGITPSGGEQSYIDSGVSLIRSQNVLDLSFNYDGLAHIDDDTADMMQNVEVLPGDILLNITGDSVARVCMVPEDVLPARVNQHVMILRTNDEVISGFLLAYLFVNKELLLSLASAGSSRKALTKEMISSIELDILPIKQQKIISDFLIVFNKEIELITQINDNLLAVLRTAVDKYFCYLPEDMPDNWRRVMLPELASIIPGYSYKGNELVEYSEDALVTIKNFERNGGFKIEGYKDLEISPRVKDSQFVDLFDILIAHTDLTQGAEIIGNAEIILSKGKYNKLVASMDLVKIQPNGNVGRYLLAALLSGYNFKGHCLGYVNGTTVLHLGKDATKEYAIALPSNQETLHGYDLFCKVIYHTISENMVEIEKLTELRDCLLPKLMSGEVDVSTIDLPTKYSFSTANTQHEQDNQRGFEDKTDRKNR
ncbi:type I restriction-modification system S subunit HsdS [methanogenic archaeon mixed culture ISO4-G1]|nr:type I restriction-modification system S subunit HsdS [methanogenic archaeon mixed culture ISO4-G1]